MKKPVIERLKVDAAETRKIRSAMAHQKSIKITINIDAQSLAAFRILAQESGVPYQRLINRKLAQSLADKTKAESRLERIEQEIRALKRKIAA